MARRWSPSRTILPVGTRQLEPRDVIASAPSGKAFTGQIVLYPDAAGAGSCMFHGHLALQG